MAASKANKTYNSKNHFNMKWFLGFIHNALWQNARVWSFQELHKQVNVLG
jgi:hypothetical protein